MGSLRGLYEGDVKNKYVEAFFRNVDWSVVKARLRPAGRGT